MQIELDPDVEKVAVFMQENIQASKLVGVSNDLPKIAQLLWSVFPQELCQSARLSVPKTSLCNQSQSASTE